MIIKATEQQVKEMAALAVNASRAVGMGVLHATDKEFKPEDFALENDEIYMDYVQGRMVKLGFEGTKEESLYSTRAFPPNTEYQSWGSKFPGTKLIDAVGATVISE